jgi:hypothetical protein
MDLKIQAEKEAPRRTRSKLEEHCEAILTLRRKHWSYRQIAEWLKAHGVPVNSTSVLRFCKRFIVRRPRSTEPSAADESGSQPVLQSFPEQTPQIQTNNPAPVRKYRFNMPE